MTDTTDPTTRLTDIARTLRSGEPVPAITVREFLRWFFGTQRRGRWIVTHIRHGLDEAGLRTVPDFESTYLDAEMMFELATPTVAGGGALRMEVAETVTISATSPGP